MRKNTSGFTIVELLIVIVVIAVLATISVVAYTGIQARAQDSRRISDLQSITKALATRKVDTGDYPSASYSGLGGQSGYESSAREADGEFLASLKTYGFSSDVPVDPINTAIEDSISDARNNNKSEYVYYRYNAGDNGCDSARGRYYILAAIRMSTTGMDEYPDSPGFSCGVRDWQWEFPWVTGGFEN